MHYVILELDRRGHTAPRQLSTCQPLCSLHTLVHVCLIIHECIELS